MCSQSEDNTRPVPGEAAHVSLPSWERGRERERPSSAVTSHLHTFTLASVGLNNVFAQKWKFKAFLICLCSNRVLYSNVFILHENSVKLWTQTSHPAKSHFQSTHSPFVLFFKGLSQRGRLWNHLKSFYLHKGKSNSTRTRNDKLNNIRISHPLRSCRCVSNVTSGRKNRSFVHSGGPGNDARGARAAAPEL